MSKSGGSSNQYPTAPSWLTQALQGNIGGAGGLPSLSSLFSNFPQMGISPATYGDIGEFQQMANQGPGTYTNANINAAGKGLQSFIGGGPGQPSAATEAGLKEFNTLQAPGIENYENSMGLGNSGAAGEALATGQQQALVPLLEQDQSNQLSAASSLGQLGATQGQLGQGAYGEQLGALEQAFGAQQLPQQSQFNQQMGQEQLASGYRQQLEQLLGSLFGQRGSNQSMGFDLSSLF